MQRYRREFNAMNMIILMPRQARGHDACTPGYRCKFFEQDMYLDGNLEVHQSTPYNGENSWTFELHGTTAITALKLTPHLPPGGPGLTGGGATHSPLNISIALWLTSFQTALKVSMGLCWVLSDYSSEHSWEEPWAPPYRTSHTGIMKVKIGH